MKKIIAFIFTLTCILSLVGCAHEKTEDPNQTDPAFSGFETGRLHSVAVEGAYAEETELKQSYHVGEEVTIKLPTVAEQYYVLDINGEKHPLTNSEAEYTCFTFTMPDEDVVLVIEAVSAAIPEGSPGSAEETIRIDERTVRKEICDLYLQVLEDLWKVDPGLNDGISQLGIDLSGLSHLTEEEKEKVMQDFSSKHDLPYIVGTWDELCDQGYIDRENLSWKDGLFFSVKTDEEAVWNLPFLKKGDSAPELTAFDAHKWRSGLGAYFFGQCTAQKNPDGGWSYTVGQEAIS